MEFRDVIALDNMVAFLNDCKEMGVKAITWTGGGDPLVYPHIYEACSILHDSPIKMGMLTNGQNLKGKVAQLLSESASWLRISIDGYDDESYAKYRSIPIGRFSKLMKNMEKFISLDGGCTVGVIMNVDQNNASEIFDTARRIKAIGVKSFKIAPITLSSDYGRNEDMIQNLKDSVKEQHRKCIEELASESFEIVEVVSNMTDYFFPKASWCPITQIAPILGADMKLYDCCNRMYNPMAVLADLSEIRMKDFWHQNKSIFFRTSPKSHCLHH